MLDLTKALLPDSVMVSGQYFKIHTDFRYWINFGNIIKNDVKNAKGVLLTDFDFLYVDKKPNDRQKGLEALFAFYMPKRALPRTTGEINDVTLYDFTLDSDLIFSAFYQQYKIDLFDEKLKLHWHKFNALLEGLRETKFTDVIGYRSYSSTNKKQYDQTMSELKRAWEIKEEQPLSEKEKEELKKFEDKLK